MTHPTAKLTMAVVACALVATAFGCGTSSETYFYQLATMPGGGAAKAATPDLRLGVGPVSLPSYLDRSQVVVREDAHGLELKEFNQWAEPLEENFVRVFAENLAARLGTDRVILHPWDSAGVDCQVAVRVIRFECDGAGTCTLEARWVLDDGKKRVQKASKHEASVAGDRDSVASMVSAMSRALGAFSDEVATAVKKQP